MEDFIAETDLQALEVLVVQALHKGDHVAPHLDLHAGLRLLRDLIVALVVLVHDDIWVLLQQDEHLNMLHTRKRCEMRYRSEATLLSMNACSRNICSAQIYYNFKHEWP